MNDDVLLKLLQWSNHKVGYHASEMTGSPPIDYRYYDYEFTYQGLHIQYYYDEGERVETAFILTDLDTGKKYTVPGDAEVIGDRICYLGGPGHYELVVERV